MGKFFVSVSAVKSFQFTLKMFQKFPIDVWSVHGDLHYLT